MTLIKTLWKPIAIYAPVTAKVNIEKMCRTLALYGKYEGVGDAVQAQRQTHFLLNNNDKDLYAEMSQRRPLVCGKGRSTYVQIHTR